MQSAILDGELDAAVAAATELRGLIGELLPAG
jgi:hypothetical protein